MIPQSTILGIGTAVPERILSQEEALGLALQLSPPANEEAKRQVELIYRRSGVERRGIAAAGSVCLDAADGDRGFRTASAGRPEGPGTSERMAIYAAHASSLATRSASLALECASSKASEITHLVTASCTGFGAPGWDVDLVERLGLPRHVQRTNVGFMGCHAALNALRVADAFVRTDAGARVLLCCTEICSAHFHYGAKPDQIVANALFADGSAAVVLSQTGNRGAAHLRSFSSCIIPETRDQMAWAVGDHGFEMRLGIELPGTIRRTAGEWLGRWLAGQGLQLEDIGSWAVHPGGPKILSSVAEALTLPAKALEDSKNVLAEHGNMSSPTALFILNRVLSRTLDKPCVMLSFGPGITAEAALFLP
ncbi:MAG: type III polyketide synthase [Planctomycetes bacterium]|nr:type III polyketide synthase [Planctomycetota bacterium]